VLVHEWGHLRWGLFDEYTTKKSKRFYMDSGVWNPSRYRILNFTVKNDKFEILSQRKTGKTSQNNALNTKCKMPQLKNFAELSLSAVRFFNWGKGK
jgi:hypothetical protein